MKLIVSFLILINFSLVYTQVPTLDWAVSSTGAGYLDIATGLVVDDSGNSYTVGTFMSQTDFDPGLGVFNLTPNGAEDIFIQKLNSNGQFVWAIQIGGNGPNEDDHAAEICLDHNNNLLITGNFSGAGDFDPSSNNFILNSNSIYADCFVAKYTNNGGLIWAKSIGGGNIDAGRSIAVFSNNDVVISGQFFGPVDFDPGTGSTVIFPNVPYNNGSLTHTTDFFTLKLNSSGDFIWANINGDFSDDIAYCSVDSDDNIIQAGRYAGTFDIDPGIGVLNLNSGNNASYATFVRKLSNAGNLIWGKTLFNNPSSSSDILSLTIDNNNDLILTGYFIGTVDFDPNTSIYNLTSNGASDCFTLKLNSNGDFLWARTIGGNANALEAGASLTNDESNNIYVLGYLESNGNIVDFDNGPNTYFLPDEDGTFLVKYNSNGDLLWAIRVERSLDLNQIFYCWETSSGPGVTGGKCIDVRNNSIYIAGAFSHTIDFDPSVSDYFITATTTSGSMSATDIFVHKLIECTPFNGTIDTTCCSSYTAPNGQVYTSTGSYNCVLNYPNGCDTSYVINLTINQPPLTPIVTLSNNVELSTQTQNNVTYQWVFCSDNLPISGAVNPTFTAIENSLYYVIVTNNCGSDTSECATVNTIGFNELQWNNVQIFPNPSNGIFNLKLHSSINSPLFFVTDLQGRILLTEQLMDSEMKVDLSKFSNGTYFIHLDGIGTFQLVKQ
jgi:hypothetical protein